MKVLCVKQPWAWLIVNGHKDIENRTWKTNYRGNILIHAGKKVDLDGEIYLHEEFPDMPRKFATQMERGGIVGQVEIVDCVKFSPSAWFSGPYGFVLRNAKPLKFIPLKGQLGLFEYVMV